jgi:hypothetical protein
MIIELFSKHTAIFSLSEVQWADENSISWTTNSKLVARFEKKSEIIEIQTTYPKQIKASPHQKEEQEPLLSHCYSGRNQGEDNHFHPRHAVRRESETAQGEIASPQQDDTERVPYSCRIAQGYD